MLNVITSVVSTHVGPTWKMYEETPMAKTGLVLRPTDRSTIEQIGQRQPDWLLISGKLKRIAIPDLCLPFDVLPFQLLAAAKRKQHAYSPWKRPSEAQLLHRARLDSPCLPAGVGS